MNEREPGVPVTPTASGHIEEEELRQSPLLKEEPDPIGLAARVAGGVLVLNVALVVGTALALGSFRAAAGSFETPLPYLIDLVIGIALLAGRRRLIPWAVFRTALGAVVGTGLALAQSDPATAVLQLVYCGSLLMLLVGRPGRLRFRVGAALAGSLAVYFAFSWLFLPVVEGELYEVEDGVVRTEQASVRPPEGYRLRELTAARVDNAEVDAWMVDTRRDAHLQLFCDDTSPEAPFDAETYLENMRGHLDSLEGARVTVPGALGGSGGVARARLEASAVSLGTRFRYLVEIVVRPDRACAAWALASDDVFDVVRPGLDAALGTVELLP